MGCRAPAGELWVQEGCPDGRSEEHWQQAQCDVLESRQAAPAAEDQPEEAPTADALIDVAEEIGAVPAERETCSELDAADPVPSFIQAPRKGTSLFKIRERQCRYVVSETSSPTIFCGAPTEGGSWCQEHRVRVFVVSSVRSPARIDPRKLSAW